MIVSIGFVPDALGKALASPIQTPGRVVQLAPRVGDRGLRVGAHPAGAHLVRREQQEVARGDRVRVEVGDERLEVVAALPVAGLAVAADDLLGPGRLVDADQLLDPGADVADVELVGDRILR